MQSGLGKGSELAIGKGSRVGQGCSVVESNVACSI